MHTTSCSIYDEIKITSCSRDALKYVHVENAPGNSGPFPVPYTALLDIKMKCFALWFVRCLPSSNPLRSFLATQVTHNPIHLYGIQLYGD